MPKIPLDVIEIIGRSIIKENVLFLPPIQLDRKLYLSVNKCLTFIGGKWNRYEKGHIFDTDPSDLLDEMLNTGEFTDVKKEFQFFETPKDIVFRMINLANIKSGEILLEPSAGHGAILDEFPKENYYVAIELFSGCVDVLRNKGYSVSETDFLTVEPMDVDKIVMNPPFSKQQDIDHVLHAWACLAPGGRLVSIMSNSPFFRENKKSKDFRTFLNMNNARVIDLDPGAFKESGTMVNTKIVVIDKAF